MRCPTYTTRGIFVALVFTFLAVAASVQPLTASDCECTTVTDTIVATICIGGADYDMEIYLCDVGTPGTGGSCNSSYVQNRFSVLHKICFLDPRPAGLTNVQIISAILCDIKNSACDPTNQWGINVPNGSVYCWEIRTPKCTTTDMNGCIVPCGTDIPCCRMELRWKRESGNCYWDPLPVYTCEDPGTCTQGCEQGCPTVTGCCE